MRNKTEHGIRLKQVALFLIPDDHARLKVLAFHKGTTIQAFLRGLVKAVVYANDAQPIPRLTNPQPQEKT